MQRLQRAGVEIELTKKYVNHRVEILANFQRKILNAITDAKIEKAPLDRLVWSASVLYDKERLELGKSTHNIAYADIIRAKVKLQEEINALDSFYEDKDKQE